MTLDKLEWEAVNICGECGVYYSDKSGCPVCFLKDLMEGTNEIVLKHIESLTESNNGLKEAIEKLLLKIFKEAPDVNQRAT